MFIKVCVFVKQSVFIITCYFCRSQSVNFIHDFYMCIPYHKPPSLRTVPQALPGYLRFHPISTDLASVPRSSARKAKHTIQYGESCICKLVRKSRNNHRTLSYRLTRCILPWLVLFLPRLALFYQAEISTVQVASLYFTLARTILPV